MSSKDKLLATALGPWTELIYAVLRIVAGAAFMLHGLQKVFGLLDGNKQPLLSQMGVGGLIELVGGALIAIGLFTRWAAFVCSGTMAVAYIQFHWKGSFDSGFFPVVNGGELALIYCFLFLYIAARGAGRLSLEGKAS